MRGALYVGGDGCRGGRWVCVATDGANTWNVRLFGSTRELWSDLSHADRILLDVPIGLPDRGPRACDVEARRMLGRRASSVFPAPERWLMACSDLAAADRAKAARERRAVKVQRQMWNIVPRVREVDELLRGVAGARNAVRECHPEVCFAALAGSPLMPPKKTTEGVESRLAVLKTWVPDVRGVVERAYAEHRAVLGRDDVIDALVCAVCAAAPADELRTLPEKPERDECGLSMEMVYRVPRPG